MPRWILVRHAQSVANAERFLSGHLDVPLTEQGRDEARALGALLRPHAIARVVSSDLQRARDTAWLALEGRTRAVRMHEGLRERHLGAWGGIGPDEAEAVGAWDVLTSFERSPPGGESLHAVCVRATRTLARLPEGPVTLVVAHGGVLRGLIGLLDDAPRTTIASGYIPNAVPVVRDLPEGTWARLHRHLLEVPP